MFQVGKPVTGKEFLDRTKMIKEFEKNIKNHQSLMIKAPRRYGKTSLAKEVFIRTKVDYLFLDYRRTPRAELIAEKIIDYVYSFAGIDGFMKKITKNVMSFFQENSKSIKIDMKIFTYTLEFLGESKSANEKLMFAFDLAEKVAKDLELKLYLVHDEFQDVTKLNSEQEDILELLRSTLQHQEHLCHYFLGSNESMMSNIFESKKSPFFQFCRIMDLKGFNQKELHSQLIEKFKSKMIVFESNDELLTLLERLNGHPANTMIVMQALYYIALDKDLKLMKKKELDKAYETGFSESIDLVERYILDISANKHYHDVIYRMANSEEQVLKGQALNQVLKGLMSKGYIYRIERGKYQIIDGFLIDYLRGFE